MIETRRLKNIVIFIQTVLSFALSRKIRNLEYIHGRQKLLTYANLLLSIHYHI